MYSSGRCAHCGKAIWRSGAGSTWLHRRTASASCYPGSGSWKTANPQEVVQTGHSSADDRGLTFDRGVTCGGCGELLPDQEGIARDCACVRIEAIECICPDANLDNGTYLDECPKHGKDATANQAAAEDRTPWYAEASHARS